MTCELSQITFNNMGWNSTPFLAWTCFGRFPQKADVLHMKYRTYRDMSPYLYDAIQSYTTSVPAIKS